jgi:hypothetical protein
LQTKTIIFNQIRFLAERGMSISQSDGLAYSKRLREMDVGVGNDIIDQCWLTQIFSYKNNKMYILSVVEDDAPQFDAACDPAHPKTVKFQDISAAAYKIKGGIVRTPCTVSVILWNV